jgi:hypothetical protein
VSPEETALAAVIGVLTRLQIPYMLTASVAASYHGRPRATHDADLVIDPTPLQVEPLVEALVGAGFYVDLDGARAALADRRQFNVIEMTHACRIDLIVRRSHAFSEQEFLRRQVVDLPFAQGVSIVTKEDSVLSTLEWARLSGDSDRQVADAAAIVAMNADLDRPYIERWATVLGVTDLWRRVSGPG